MSDDRTIGTHGSVRLSRAEDFPVLAVAAGLVAALIGGGIWAAIAIFGNLEVGWVAWGIGALVGGAMAMATPARSRRLATVAAALALVGLVAGKAMTFAGSAGPIADEILTDDGYMQGMTAWRLYATGELEPTLQAAVEDTEVRGDTLTDALWADMLAAASSRLADMSEAEKQEVAREAAAGMMAQMGLAEGIRAQISAFDLLWIFLALATAWRMMDAPKAEAPAPAPIGAPKPEEKELV